MAFPAANAISTAADQGDLQTALEDFLAATKKLPGAQAETELTIAAGSVTATRYVHSIDTESDAAADDLDVIDVTGLEDGSLLLVRAENAARVPTLQHAAGGAGSMLLLDGQDVPLIGTSRYVLFYVDKSGTAFLQEIARFGFGEQLVVEASTAGSGAPNVLAASESGKLLTNKGAGADAYNTLPAAVAGLKFGFARQNATYDIRATAAAGDTILVPEGETPAAGYIESTADGNAVWLVCVDDGRWQAMSSVGTWAVSS